MGISTPVFSSTYALLIFLLIAVCISLFRPKKNSRALSILQFSSYSSFCLARVQYWTIGLLFSYALPHIAATMYLLSIILIVIISASRANLDMHYNLNILDEQSSICYSDNSNELSSIATLTQTWSDQLTWFLIAYLFQKLIGATLLVNSGASTLVASLVFDPWLIVCNLWTQYIQTQLLNIEESNKMSQCMSKFDNNHDLFNSLEEVIIIINNVNICLWAMFVTSFTCTLFIDYICTAFKECKHCFDSDRKKKKNDNDSKVIKIKTQK